MTGYNAQVTNTDKEFKNFARAWSARDEILISWIKSKEDTIPNIPIRKLFKVLFTELEYGQCTRMVNKIHNILFWKKVKPKTNSTFVTLSLSLRNRLLLSKKKHWLNFSWVVEWSYHIWNEFFASIFEKYRHHPSIKATKKYIEEIEKPSFTETTKSIIVTDIKTLNPKITSESNNISAKPMKGFSDMFVGIIVNNFNKYLNNRTFSESFKLSEFLPVYKRYEPDDKITMDR